MSDPLARRTVLKTGVAVAAGAAAALALPPSTAGAGVRRRVPAFVHRNRPELVSGVQSGDMGAAGGDCQTHHPESLDPSRGRTTEHAVRRRAQPSFRTVVRDFPSAARHRHRRTAGHPARGRHSDLPGYSRPPAGLTVRTRLHRQVGVMAGRAPPGSCRASRDAVGQEVMACVPVTLSRASFEASGDPGATVYTTMRRSVPGTVRTSQSISIGPTGVAVAVFLLDR